MYKSEVTSMSWLVQSWGKLSPYSASNEEEASPEKLVL